LDRIRGCPQVVVTDFLARLFVRSRLVLALGVVALTGMSVWGYLPKAPQDEPVKAPPRRARAENDSSTKKNSTDQSAPERVESEFQLTKAECLLLVEAGDLFTPRTMQAVRQMVRDVQSLDIVDSVVWLESAPGLNIFGLADPLLPPEGASAERWQIARQRALAHPLVAGQLLSDDGTALQILIGYDWLFMTRDDSGALEIMRQANASLARSLGDDASKVKIRATGRIPLWKAERDAFSSDHRKYQIIAYTMITLLALILFRGLVPVLIVGVGSMLAVFWTFGLLKFFDHEPNDMTAVVMPVLVAMVSFTDGVHLMIHIRRKRADGLPPVEAAAAAIRQVGLPCFLTSLTTGIGFCSLLSAKSEYIQNFGWDCAFGVAAGFVAMVTVIPLLSSSWLGKRLESRGEDELVGRSLERFRPGIDWILRHSRMVTAAGVLATAAFAAVGAQLRPDEKWEYAMPTGAPAYQAMAWCGEAFGGIEFAHVTVSWNGKEEVSPGQVLQVVGEVKQLVEREPHLKHPLAIGDLLATFPNDADDPEALMSYASLLPPQLRDLLYDPQKREAKVLMRCQDHGIRLYAPVFKRVDAGLASLAARYPGFTFDLDGGPVWRAENLYQVVVDLAASLGSAAIIILLVIAVVYRSIQLGLIAVIPNVLPLVVTAALLVWTNYALTIAAVCAFTVCLGIAVDDTIHFLSRFQAELEATGNVEDAIRRSFLSVGGALITTTLVLVAGFATVLGSQMPAHRIFAGMAVSTIGTALIGDLILLPAMLAACYRPRRPAAAAAMTTDRGDELPVTPRIATLGLEP
jgi:predicted RND superfamily exporter protein